MTSKRGIDLFYRGGLLIANKLVYKRPCSHIKSNEMTAYNDKLVVLKAKSPDHDYWLISHTINRDLHAKLTKAITQKKNEKCTIFLTTFGGDPDGGYRIARCFRHHYKHVRLVVPSFCKSAGTLIAISANELAIGDFGELGPLDIQVSNPNELQQNSSGLDIQQALQVNFQHALEVFTKTLVDIKHGGRLSTKLAGEFASAMAVGLVAPLYAQIDPNRLGELQRAMRIAHEYGARLNRYSNNLKTDALERLVAGYPSHSFVIDRKEAKELFTNVSAPTQEEQDLCDSIWQVLATETAFGPMLLEPSEDTNGDENEPTSEQPNSSEGAIQQSEAPQEGEG